MPIIDHSEVFNTALDPATEQQFQQWLQANGRSNDLFDYDMRGAFKDGVKDTGGHFPDKYKKPNHPTFSNESIYSNAATPGGKWIKKGDKWSFEASPFNVMMHGQDELQNYFKRVEPDNSLVLPQ